MATVPLTPEDKEDVETGVLLSAESKEDVTTGGLLTAKPKIGLEPLGDQP